MSNQKNIDSYTTAQTNYSTAVKLFHAAKERELLRKNNLGSFYRFVNRKIGSSDSTLGPIRNSSGDIVEDPVAKSNIFNEFFSSVFTADNGTVPTFEKRVSENVEFRNVNFTPAIVYAALKRLKPSTSAGSDGLPNIFLKIVLAY